MSSSSTSSSSSSSSNCSGHAHGVLFVYVYRGALHTVAGLRAKLFVASSDGASRVVLPMVDAKQLPSFIQGLEIRGAADIFDLLQLTLKGEG